MTFSKLFSSARILKGLNYSREGVSRRCCCNLPKEDECRKDVDSSKKGLVLGVYECNKKYELTPTAAEVDQKSGGKISQHLNGLCDQLELGKAFALTDVLPEYCAVAVASIGPKDAGFNKLESLDEARENVRWGVGAGVQLLKRRGCGVISVDPGPAPGAAAEAAVLAAWRFQEFKSASVRRPEVCVALHGAGGAEVAGAGGVEGAGAGGEGDSAAAQWAEGCVLAEAQNWARYLSDMPANRMTPVDLAQAALDMLCPLGVTVEAHDREWIEAQRMNAFLAVARGSCETPMFFTCQYKGASERSPPVLIAAKGVTFDSGGLCLKECHRMLENRGSMAGAAVAVATVMAIAKLKVPINVSCVIPICENMISGQCMKVGDVVKALNGLSIQIENTDMEGRLMMADALVYGQALYRPSLVIDVATFTRGVLQATGGGAFACFSNSAAAWDAVCAAGATSGDRPWRFPLWRYFHNQITNDQSVDLRNKGAGHGTPCLGAAFLRNFICGDWLHMDITGVGKLARDGAPPYLSARRMSGRPARTLTGLLQNIARHSQARRTAHDAHDAPAAKQCCGTQ